MVDLDGAVAEAVDGVAAVLNADANDDLPNKLDGPNPR